MKILTISACLILAAMLTAMRGNTLSHTPNAVPEAMTSLSGYQLVIAATGLDDSTPKSVTVNCPVGKVVIGGGAYTSGTTSGVALTSSGPNDSPPPTQWIAEAADTEGFSDNWELTGYAYCVDSAAPIANYQLIQSSTASDPSGTKTATATCPAGTALLGGGARITGLVTNEGLTQSSPADAAQPTQWLAAAHEVDSSIAGPWALHAYAFCTPTALAGPVAVATASNTNTPKSVSAACSPGGIIVGGGAQITGETSHQALTASRPSGAWAAGAHQLLSTSPAQSWGLKSYVFCIYHTYLPVIVK